MGRQGSYEEFPNHLIVLIEKGVFGRILLDDHPTCHHQVRKRISTKQNKRILPKQNLSTYQSSL